MLLIGYQWNRKFSSAKPELWKLPGSTWPKVYICAHFIVLKAIRPQAFGGNPLQLTLTPSGLCTSAANFFFVLRSYFHINSQPGSSPFFGSICISNHAHTLSDDKSKHITKTRPPQASFFKEMPCP